jgi:hypothetical protein
MSGKVGWAALLASAEKAKSEGDAELGELNSTIQQFEEALNSKKFGIQGSVLLERQESEGGVCWSSNLTYRKRGKRWCLLVESGPDNGEGDDWIVQELVHAGRDTRYRAVERFSDLLRDIVEGLHARVGKQREAMEEARLLVAALRNEKGEAK